MQEIYHTQEITRVTETHQNSTLENVEEDTGVTNIENMTNELQEKGQEPQEYVTLGDINIVSEMNASARHAEETHLPDENSKNAWYRLRLRHTNKFQFTLAQTNNQLIMSIPKRRAHIMLTQLNEKDRLKYGTRVDEAILKYLSNYTALMPRNKKEMSYNKRQKPYNT